MIRRDNAGSLLQMPSHQQLQDQLVMSWEADCGDNERRGYWSYLDAHQRFRGSS